jgi:hypothetical protein
MSVKFIVVFSHVFHENRNFIQVQSHMKQYMQLISDVTDLNAKRDT